MEHRHKTLRERGSNLRQVVQDIARLLPAANPGLVIATNPGMVLDMTTHRMESSEERVQG